MHLCGCPSWLPFPLVVFRNHSFVTPHPRDLDKVDTIPSNQGRSQCIQCMVVNVLGTKSIPPGPIPELEFQLLGKRSSLLSEIAELEWHTPGKGWGHQDHAREWREHKGKWIWETERKFVNNTLKTSQSGRCKGVGTIKKIGNAWVHQGLSSLDLPAINLHLWGIYFLFQNVFDVSLPLSCRPPRDDSI